MGPNLVNLHTETGSLAGRFHFEMVKGPGPNFMPLDPLEFYVQKQAFVLSVGAHVGSSL